MRQLVLAALAAVLAAPAFGQAGHEQPVASVLRVWFSCDNGQEVEMLFYTQQGTAVLVHEGKTVELQQQLSGSGFIYGGGAYLVRGKGDDISIEIDSRAPIKCTAR